MKRILFTLLFLGVFGVLMAQTGIGWGPINYKVNFRDSINIAKGWKIGGTVILPSAQEINYIDGVTSAIQGQINGKLNISDTALMLSKYPRALNSILTGVTTFASPFTLGATSVTTTGTQFNYLNAATGTTGTTSSSIVFSEAPTLNDVTLDGNTVIIDSVALEDVVPPIIDDIVPTMIADTMATYRESAGDLETVTIMGKILLKTIGVVNEAGVDYNFVTAANHTAQNIEFNEVIPAKARVIALEIVCTETCVNSDAAVDITFRAGNASAGEQFISSLSCDDLNEVVGIYEATGLDKSKIVIMNWASATDIFIGGDPDQEWDTMTAGRWAIYVTYINYEDI